MTGTDTAIGVPAAWYPDPAGTPLLRWWDGATWTAHTVDPPSAAPALPAAPQWSPSPARTPASTPSPLTAGTAYAPTGGADTRTDPAGSSFAPLYGQPSRSGSTLTVWVWLLAFFPVAQSIATMLIVVGFPELPDSVLRYVFLGAAVLAHLTFARNDARVLESRGYTAPRVGWALLPVVYLIIRTVRVGRLTLWPLFIRAITDLVVVALVVLAVVLPLFLAARAEAGYVDAGSTVAAAISAEERATQLTQPGMEQALAREFEAAGAVVNSVACTPLTSTVPGTATLCTIDADIGRSELDVEVAAIDNPYSGYIVTGSRPLA